MNKVSDKVMFILKFYNYRKTKLIRALGMVEHSLGSSKKEIDLEIINTTIDRLKDKIQGYLAFKHLLDLEKKRKAKLEVLESIYKTFKKSPAEGGLGVQLKLPKGWRRKSISLSSTILAVHSESSTEMPGTSYLELTVSRVHVTDGVLPESLVGSKIEITIPLPKYEEDAD